MKNGESSVGGSRVVGDFGEREGTGDLQTLLGICVEYLERVPRDGTPRDDGAREYVQRLCREVGLELSEDATRRGLAYGNDASGCVCSQIDQAGDGEGHRGSECVLAGGRGSRGERRDNGVDDDDCVEAHVPRNIGHVAEHCGQFEDTWIKDSEGIEVVNTSGSLDVARGDISTVFRSFDHFTSVDRQSVDIGQYGQVAVYATRFCSGTSDTEDVSVVGSCVSFGAQKRKKRSDRLQMFAPTVHPFRGAIFLSFSYFDKRLFPVYKLENRYFMSRTMRDAIVNYNLCYEAPFKVMSVAATRTMSVTRKTSHTYWTNDATAAYRVQVPNIYGQMWTETALDTLNAMIRFHNLVCCKDERLVYVSMNKRKFGRHFERHSSGVLLNGMTYADYSTWIENQGRWSVATGLGRIGDPTEFAWTARNDSEQSLRSEIQVVNYKKLRSVRPRFQCTDMGYCPSHYSRFSSESAFIDHLEARHGKLWLSMSPERQQEFLVAHDCAAGVIPVPN